MLLENNTIDWSQLIKITSAGVIVADYLKIKEAVVKKFKDVYGDDIDVSTASADGIYVENYCLMINNILQAFKLLYSNLDVNKANGNYLDILCNLSNVSRKQGSYSNASLTIKLMEGEAPISLNYGDKLQFVDRGGTTWTYTQEIDRNNPVVIDDTKETSLVVICDSFGPVSAGAGWINALVDTSRSAIIKQATAANVGSYKESDSHLRARRNESLGAVGTSVLESLAGALLSIDGIDDVKVVNNVSASDIIIKDNTKVEVHDVYIIIRKRPNIDVSDKTIGTIIYEKMTPGIKTTNPGKLNDSTQKREVLFGNIKYYDCVQYIFNNALPALGDLTQRVYWKEAVPEAPALTIKIKPNEYFAKGNSTTTGTGDGKSSVIDPNSTIYAIAQAVINYVNALPVCSPINMFDVGTHVVYADPLFRGKRTFTYVGSNIFAETLYEDEYPGHYSYYNYTTVKYSEADQSTGIMTIVLQ